MSLISRLFRCIDSCKTQNIDVLIEQMKLFVVVNGENTSIKWI